MNKDTDLYELADSYFHLKKRNEDIRTAAEALGRLATIG